MDTAKHLRISMPALPRKVADVPDTADFQDGSILRIPRGVRRRMEHSGSAMQAGSIVVNFSIGSDRYNSSFAHGPNGVSVDRCE